MSGWAAGSGAGCGRRSSFTPAWSSGDKPSGTSTIFWWHVFLIFGSFLPWASHDLKLSAKYWTVISGPWWGPSPATTRTGVSAPWWSWTATRPVTTRWGSARPGHWSPAGGQPGWWAWWWWSQSPGETRTESLCLNNSVTHCSWVWSQTWEIMSNRNPDHNHSTWKGRLNSGMDSERFQYKSDILWGISKQSYTQWTLSYVRIVP